MLERIHEKDREKFLLELSDERFHREGRAECEYRIKDKEGEYHYYRQYNAKVNVLSGPKMAILIRNVDEFRKISITPLSILFISRTSLISASIFCEDSRMVFKDGYTDQKR